MIATFNKDLLDGAGKRSPIMIRDALNAGADVNATEESLNATALMIASAQGCAECISLLIEAGANVDERDKEGETALMYAVRAGSATCVKSLIHYDADVDKMNNSMITAYWLAESLGKKDVAELIKPYTIESKLREYCHNKAASKAGDGTGLWLGL